MSAIQIKCVVVGDGAVGKTSLLMTGCTNTFPTEYIGSVFDNYSMQLMVDGRMYSLSLWDTQGQDDYQKLRVLNYPDTDVFIICFSISDPISFEHVSTTWYPEVHNYCPNASVILLATKLDLREDQSVIEQLHRNNKEMVSASQGQSKCREIKAAQYLECSALTQEGLFDVFKHVARCVQPPTQTSKKKKKCIII